MANQAIHILKQVGLKITSTRELIFGVFSADCKPVNAEFIYTKLKSKGINQVTIYRTLASFEEKGIIKKVDLRKDSVYYELAGHHHHHIICTDCGMTESFEACDIDQISQKALKRSSRFKVVNQHSLELFGLCTNCAK